MNARMTAVRLVVGLAVVALVGGCAATATPAPSPTMSPSPTGTTPLATPTSTPAAPSESPAAATATPVSGTMTLYYMSFDGATTAFATNPDDSLHPRDAAFGPAGVTVSTDDPRVSGSRTFHWNQDRWGDVDNGPIAGVQWGTGTIENDGGTWEGTGSGVFSPDRGDIIAAWYRGSGGYAGLGYFELLTGGQPWTIRGLIFPGDPPDLGAIPLVTAPQPSPNIDVIDTPAPLPVAEAAAYGPLSVTAGTSVYTVVDLETSTFAGIATSNDPRTGGEFLAPAWTLRFEQVPGDDFGIGTQWGPSRLTNAGGAWNGACSGVYDGSDAFACWYKGTGGYAGLGYFELVIRSDYFGPIPGEVSTGAFGMVFPGDPPTP